MTMDSDSTATAPPPPAEEADNSPTARLIDVIVKPPSGKGIHLQFYDQDPVEVLSLQLLEREETCTLVPGSYALAHRGSAVAEDASFASLLPPGGRGRLSLSLTATALSKPVLLAHAERVLQLSQPFDLHPGLSCVSSLRASLEASPPALPARGGAAPLAQWASQASPLDFGVSGPTGTAAARVGASAALTALRASRHGAPTAALAAKGDLVHLEAHLPQGQVVFVAGGPRGWRQLAATERRFSSAAHRSKRREPTLDRLLAASSPEFKARLAALNAWRFARLTPSERAPPAPGLRRWLIVVPTSSSSSSPSSSSSSSSSSLGSAEASKTSEEELEVLTSLAAAALDGGGVAALPFTAYPQAAGAATRDWNLEAQEVLDLPSASLDQRRLRERLLERLREDFSSAALRLAERAFSGDLPPLNPREGIDQHCFLAENVFLCYAGDFRESHAAWGGERAPWKASDLDLLGLSRVAGADCPAVRAPLTCLVDVGGRRILVQSVVQGVLQRYYKLRYGTEDPPAPRRLHWTPEFHRAVAPLAEAWRLPETQCPVPEGQEPLAGQTREGHLPFFLSTDAKGIEAVDERLYLLECGFLTPPDTAFAEFPAARLRPELFEVYLADVEKRFKEERRKTRQEAREKEQKEKEKEKEQSSSDAEKEKEREKEKEKDGDAAAGRERAEKEFAELRARLMAEEKEDSAELHELLKAESQALGYAPNAEQAGDAAQMAHNAEVTSKLNDYLADVVIPRASEQLSGISAGELDVGAGVLSAFFHESGLGMRHLGAVLERTCSAPAREVLLMDLMVRLAKAQLRGLLARCAPEEQAEVVVGFFNALLGNVSSHSSHSSSSSSSTTEPLQLPLTSARLWQRLAGDARVFFHFSLPLAAAQRLTHSAAAWRALSRCCGVRWRVSANSQLPRFTTKVPLHLSDFAGFFPVLKQRWPASTDARNLLRLADHHESLPEKMVFAREALAVAAYIHPRAHPVASEAHSLLGALEYAFYNPDALLPHLEEALLSTEQRAGPDAWETTLAFTKLGDAARPRDPLKALCLLRRARAGIVWMTPCIARAAMADNAQLLAHALVEGGRAEAAAQLLLDGLKDLRAEERKIDQWREKQKPNSISTPAAAAALEERSEDGALAVAKAALQETLAQVHNLMRRPELAVEFQKKACDTLAAALPQEDRRLAKSRAHLQGYEDRVAAITERKKAAAAANAEAEAAPAAAAAAAEATEKPQEKKAAAKKQQSGKSPAAEEPQEVENKSIVLDHQPFAVFLEERKMKIF